MSEAKIGHGKSIAEIVFHFDVANHSIPLRQFIDTANSAKSILDDWDEQLFDRKLNYQLRISAPESGGLVEALTLVLAPAGAVWAFLCTDIGKAYFKGLVGEDPTVWAERLGEKTRNLLTRTRPPDDHERALPALDHEALAVIEARLLAELVTQFYALGTENLKAVGISLDRFRKAFEARNRFYKACLDNSEILGVAFDRDHHFPLQRADFTRQIARIPDFELTDDEPVAWAVETVDILVNSPNWKRDGRKWQASTSSHKDIAFSIEDEAFWYHVDVKDIQPDIRDNMRVQWAYPAGLSKPAQVRVLRVVSYNGTPISDPVDEATLTEQLGEAHMLEPDEPTLFDQANKFDAKDEDGGES